MGLEFTKEDIEDGKQFIKDFDFMYASCLEKLNSGQQLLFTIDEIAQRNGRDSSDLIYTFLASLGAFHPLSKFEELTGKINTKARTRDLFIQGDNTRCNGNVCERDSPTHVAEWALLSSSSHGLNCQHLLVEDISPLFSSLKNLMQGNVQGTVVSVQKFISTKGLRNGQCVGGLQMADVDLNGCRFSGLDKVVYSDVCSQHEKSLILRILMELSYRRTNHHVQTQWLIDLMSQDRALQLFCKARLYTPDSISHSDKKMGENRICKRFLTLFTHCVSLQQAILNNMKLSKYEKSRQLAVLNDALGLLEAKDPRGCSLARVKAKLQHHDLARNMRKELLSSSEDCGPLEKVILLFDAYASTQSAGYSRAILSCIDSSKSFDERMELAREAEVTHQESMNEQTSLLENLGLSSDELYCTPSMLAARFDNMLRHVRPMQLSQLLRGFSNTQTMLSHLHTELDCLQDLFGRIPTQNRDDNIEALCNGMLTVGAQLERQIYAGTMEPFALDNPYIPE